MPITRTTSPSASGRDRARRAGRARRTRVSSVDREPASSASVAARAAERAVSGRRAPGIATTTGERPSSQARATSAGVAPCASATSASAWRRASPPARRGPPSGEWAITATPRSAQRSTTPPRSARVVERAERDLDGRDRGELERLVQLPAVDVRDPDATHEALVDEPRESAHRRSPRRSRIGCVDEVEVDREPVQRDRGSPRSRRGSPSRGRPGSRRRRCASCRPWSRSAPSPPRRTGGERGRPAPRCRRRRAPCRTPSRPPRRRRRPSRARAPRRGHRRSTGACSRDRRGAPRRRARQGDSGRER